jgi:hypothetical protein
MNAILSHQPTTAYDAEISGQDTSDLLSDLNALRANLRRKSLSKFPDIDTATRATFRQWEYLILEELAARGVSVPAPKRKRVA